MEFQGCLSNLRIYFHKLHPFDLLGVLGSSGVEPPGSNC